MQFYYPSLYLSKYPTPSHISHPPSQTAMRPYTEQVAIPIAFPGQQKEKPKFPATGVLFCGRKRHAAPCRALDAWVPGFPQIRKYDPYQHRTTTRGGF